jgi:hypothetical protein
MNQDKAIFMSQCSALPHKNNEILILILPLLNCILFNCHSSDFLSKNNS